MVNEEAHAEKEIGSCICLTLVAAGRLAAAQQSATGIPLYIFFWVRGKRP